MTTTFCGDCNEPLIDTLAVTDVNPLKACPRCGSTKRRLVADIREAIEPNDNVQAGVISYPQALLANADAMYREDKHGIAVVVAHMACEVATERALSQAFRDKGVEFLEEAVTSLINGYNLAIDRNRKLYNALTGDPVQERPFWPEFKASATRRNDVMHKGRILSKLEAEASLSAARQLVLHLGQ